MDVWIKNIGEHRGAPRLWFEGHQVIRAGFAPGDKFDLTIDGDRVVLSANRDGSRTVSAKKKGDRQHPVIDINSRELLALFEGMSAVRIVVQKGKVVILPLASELKKRERLDRVTRKMASGEPLRMGSVSHGGGVLSHAIHQGLKDAGIEADLSFANEIRADLLEQAIEQNDAWSETTAALALPMQELVQDEWLLSRLPLLEIAEMGLPCSGASRAGVSKKGLKMMEEHEHVGHLAHSALVILNKVQAAVVLFENVPDYANSASANILRLQLRDMGYQTHEAILEGKDFGCLENRIRWCMVATTEGLDFDFDKIQPSVRIVKRLGDVLDPSILPDDPRYREVEYLKKKEVRNKAAGNGTRFCMQFVHPESTSIPTLRKGYHKGGSTDPRLVCPGDPEKSRLLTSAEHARAKGVPDRLIAGDVLSEGEKHQLLGQGIVYEPFRAVGQRIGERLMELAQDKLEEEQQDCSGHIPAMKG